MDFLSWSDFLCFSFFPFRPSARSSLPGYLLPRPYTSLSAGLGQGYMAEPLYGGPVLVGKDFPFPWCDDHTWRKPAHLQDVIPIAFSLEDLEDLVQLQSSRVWEQSGTLGLARDIQVMLYDICNMGFTFRVNWPRLDLTFTSKTLDSIAFANNNLLLDSCSPREKRMVTS